MHRHSATDNVVGLMAAPPTTLDQFMDSTMVSAKDCGSFYSSSILLLHSKFIRVQYESIAYTSDGQLDLETQMCGLRSG